MDNLFAEKLNDPDQRFERVENAVLDLRQEFNEAKPSIDRLIAVESDIQNLIDQLSILLEDEKHAPLNQPLPLAHHPRAAPVTPVRENIPPAPAPAPSSNDSIIKDIRIGQHSDKIRLVLDISQNTPYSIDLDPQENLLVIELPSAAWNTATQKSFNTPLIRSYTAETINNGAGSRFIFQLNKPSKILNQVLLNPGTTRYYRLFVDLKT